MRYFDVLLREGEEVRFHSRIYLFLRNWFCLEHVGIGVPLIGWDCMDAREWDAVCDEVQKDLVRVRKKGHKLLSRKQEKINIEIEDKKYRETWDRYAKGAT